VIVISDTSPITALLTIGQIEILRALYGTVKIPPAVNEELRTWHVDIPDFIQMVPVQTDPLLLIAKKKGLLASLRDLIDRLESEAGFYLSRPVKEQVLAAAGE
jgi:predicted nucleic acid-binding protein